LALAGLPVEFLSSVKIMNNYDGHEHNYSPSAGELCSCPSSKLEGTMIHFFKQPSGRVIAIRHTQRLQTANKWQKWAYDDAIWHNNFQYDLWMTYAWW
jgi:hypothetical protein